VKELDEKIQTQAEWESLRDFDVVVSTPNCSSPGYEDIPAPPVDLFDLLIVDEAHHSAANTWRSLLASVKRSHQALFSATPFRRDKEEVVGRFVYNYPVSEAFTDGIFGRIAYVQVDPSPGLNPDVAIALKTAEVFAKDRQQGLSHCVMVRTDRKKRANELGDNVARSVLPPFVWTRAERSTGSTINLPIVLLSALSRLQNLAPRNSVRALTELHCYFANTAS